MLKCSKMWIDVHCHFDYFPNPAQILAEAQAQGVERIVSNSTSFESCKKVLELQKQFPGVVFAALGYHPDHLLKDSPEQQEKTLEFIRENASACVAFGEFGLDFDEKTPPQSKQRQLEVFRKFCGFSKEFNKPLIVHTRGARVEVLQTLREQECEKVLLHSFVGKKPQVKQLLDTPFFVSVGAGILDRSWIQDFVKELPLERLLLESDSPLEFSGEKCTPAWIPRVGKKLAELKEVSIQKVEEQAFENFCSLFPRVD